MSPSTSSLLKKAFWGIIAIFVLIQFVPYGHNHSNPPVVEEPQWDSPQTQTLAKRACYDCHSNETEWPWYSYVAPVSWLVQRDVEHGRKHLNFSDWRSGRKADQPKEVQEVVEEEEMPLAIYVPLHPHARLSDTERKQLATGLYNTVIANLSPEKRRVPRGENEDVHEKGEDQD